MKPTLTPSLRSELAETAAALWIVVEASRIVGKPYFEAVAQYAEWREGEGARLMMGPTAGHSDVAGVVVRRGDVLGKSEESMNAQKAGLLLAVDATQKLQAKVFTAIHQEVKADVRRRLADFYTPAQLEAVDMTDLEQRIGGLRVRLRNVPNPCTFAAVLAWAELTYHVLADLAADKLEFTVNPPEVPQAA